MNLTGRCRTPIHTARFVSLVTGAALLATLPLVATSAASPAPRDIVVMDDTAVTDVPPDQRREGGRPGQGRGSGVDVYVVDSGVDNVGIFESLDPGFHALGATSGDCGRNHGTYVASLIAGRGYGRAESATIVPVKVLDCDGSGSMDAVVSGLTWVLEHARPKTSIVNLSFGGEKNKEIDRVVTRLLDRGIPVVIAAGNSASNSESMSPARTGCAKDLSIVVAASTEYDSPWTRSNYGACVSIYAPGTRVFAFAAQGEKLVTGTSFAAPSVTGAIAAHASAYGVTTAEAWHLVVEQSSRSLKSGKRSDTTGRLLSVATP
jgi:subtilisin family serine protease